MLTDGRDKRLIKWLEGTNWPDGFTWTVEVALIKDLIAQKLTLKLDLETVELYLNPKILTKSDFEACIAIAIKRMSESGKIIQAVR